jgi:dihydroxyacetone kinase-like protein
VGRAGEDPGATMGLIAAARKGAIVDAAFVREWIAKVSQSMQEQREYLTQLDAAIGDADHGVNMNRGFSAVMEKLGGVESEDPGEILTVVGSTLISKVGGAAGPLYGSAFRQAGKALGDGSELDPSRLLVALRAGLEAMQKLGAAQVGDKTIVDAFVPALDAWQKELDAGGSPGSITTRAREAAEEGMRSTVPLQARKGRASYLGPRSVGHQDPGATSTALIFAALERVAGSS